MESAALGNPLTLVGSVELPRPPVARADSDQYQAELLGAWENQQAILNYSPGTIALNLQTVQDFGVATGRYIWEVTREDLDGFYLEMIGRGLAYNTRRRYGAALGAFLDYLRSRRGEQIWMRYGVVVPDIIDKYNRHRQRADEAGRLAALPKEETLSYFFAALRESLTTCRKWSTAARDYATFQVLYCVGLRVNEAVSLDVHDVHFSLGPMGKLHVRKGKGARGSGPRSRWVPMLNGLDEILKWYVNEVRSQFSGDGAALFLAESGERLSARSVRSSLQRKLARAGLGGGDRFSPHGLRRACATHNCEQGLDLLAMQELLGHDYIGTTMAYVRPSKTFVESCYQQALDRRLERLRNATEETR
jgi:site-specific recombinase XerC